VTIDALDAVGNWEGLLDGENLTADASNYVKGSGAINWDISTGGDTIAGIINTSLSAFDISEYLSEGSAFVWAYLSSAENINTFVLEIGDDESNFYLIDVTTTNEGVAFQAGWNLLRFDFVDKEVSGSPTNTACTYAAIYMSKDAEKVSETDYRFDDLVLRKGDHYDLIYYSKYGWQSAAGVWIEESTDDGDYINVDNDELRIILQKAVELGEIHLRSGRDIAAKARYDQDVAKYVQTHPSEALILTTTYHFTDL
jgi:hypothetical protein